MNRIFRFAILSASCLYATLAVAIPRENSGTIPAQAAAKPAAPQPVPQNPSNTADASKPVVPVDEKALKAYKKFQAMPDTDMAAKTVGGEDFAKKFPSSIYTQSVYSFLTIAYIQIGNMDKAQSSADKDLQLNPTDFRTMAVMSQAIARLTKDGTPETAAQLTKSETYGKAAIAGVPTMTKPEGATDENFALTKNQTLNMAHGGLGLVLVHRADFEGAIKELEQAVATGLNDDPTNFYLLGIANQNSGHPEKAAPYFEKCAAVKGNLQATCSQNLEISKKESASPTQPK